MKNTATVRPRSTNKEKDVYQSLEPLYFFTLFLGLSPYFYHGEYKSCKLLMVYSALVIISFLGFYRFVLNRPRDLKTPSIIQSIDILHIYYNNIIIVIFIIFACKEHHRIIRSTKRLSNMDQHFKKLGFNVTLNHNYTRWYLTAYLMLVYAVTSLLESMNCGYTLREKVAFSIACWIYCYISTIFSALIESQFLTFVVLLKQRFAELNKYLRELKPQMIPSHNTLKDIQSCHMELLHVVRDLNKAFSLQMLLCVGLIFVNSTLNLGHVFQHMKNEDYDWDLLTTITWAVFYLVRLFTMSLVCELTINEANNTGSLLHNIQIHPDDEDTTNTILMFSKQMLHNKLQFSAYGFFALDMSLFFSIIAAVAMYLLIMVQMDTFPKDESDNNSSITLTSILTDTLTNESSVYNDSLF